MTKYRVDWPSIERVFPLDRDPPEILKKFCLWVIANEWGSVGCFELGGCFIDDAPVRDASILRNQFAFFMVLPEGSVVGLWYPTNLNLLPPPVIVIGSEGQTEVIANSLESFLAQIASNFFNDQSAWSDFGVHEDVDSKTDLLSDWLKTELQIKNLQSVIQSPSTTLNFKAYFENWLAQREIFWFSYFLPILAQITRLLLSGKHCFRY